MKTTVRLHGQAPFLTAVLHGGPGAVGSGYSLAEELGAFCGTLEPLQTKYTIAELCAELQEQILSFSSEPIVIAGHSWGAWLGAIFAAEFPERVRHLVLIGSGPLKAEYVTDLEQRRLSHFTPKEAVLYKELLKKLEAPRPEEKDTLLEQLGRLCEKSDNYCLLLETNVPPCTLDGEMYARIWSEAAELRKSGKLLNLFPRIACPITVIHGSDDNHSVEGITRPLEETGVDFHCHPLDRCGHSPWKEKYARIPFLELMKDICLQ